MPGPRCTIPNNFNLRQSSTCIDASDTLPTWCTQVDLEPPPMTESVFLRKANAPFNVYLDGPLAIQLLIGDIKRHGYKALALFFLQPEEPCPDIKVLSLESHLTHEGEKKQVPSVNCVYRKCLVETANNKFNVPHTHDTVTNALRPQAIRVNWHKTDFMKWTFRPWFWSSQNGTHFGSSLWAGMHINSSTVPWSLLCMSFF